MSRPFFRIFSQSKAVYSGCCSHARSSTLFLPLADISLDTNSLVSAMTCSFLSCFVERSEWCELLIHFLGGSSRWTQTCKTARQFALANDICSCHYRSQYWLKLAEQNKGKVGEMVRMYCLGDEKPATPVFFFWYARMQCVKNRLDASIVCECKQHHGCSCTSDGFRFRNNVTKELECRLCKSASVSLWERECHLHNHEPPDFVCCRCLIMIHQDIKHDTATFRHYIELVDRTRKQFNRVIRRKYYILALLTEVRQINGSTVRRRSARAEVRGYKY